MAIVDDFTPAVATPSSGRRYVRRLGADRRAFFRALAAGWRAWTDYRQLSAMSDRRLEQHGLCRSDVPHEIHRRHFAGLRRWPDAVG